MGPGSTGARRAWPFVGRQEELAAIGACLDDETCGGVVLIGPAGVGKSRLARAARDLALDRDWPVEEVVATQAAASIPLGAFAHVLPDLQAAGTVLVDLLGRAAAELVSRAAGDRLLLTIDDAHLLDDASAALVHRLARSSEVFVLATVRSRAPAPDAVVGLWKDHLVARLDVQPLADHDVEALITAALGGRPNRALVHRVIDVSEGNPLVARELLLSGLEEGALAETEGVWRWQGSSGGGRRLQEFVEARIGRLTDGERAALELVAFGEPLGVSLLERLVGVEVVDALERQELVAVHREERRVLIRLVHPVYAEVLRATTPPRRAAAAQRRLADAVAAAGANRREDRLQVALWRLESGQTQGPAALIEAADEANAGFDHVLAERLAWAALPAGGTDAELVLARSLWHQGKGDQAEAVWAGVARRPDARDHLAEVAALRANNLFFNLGRIDQADRILREAEAQMAYGTARLPLSTQRAVHALYGGRPIEALELAREALDNEAASELEIVQASVIAAPAQAIIGDATGAVALCDRAFPLALELAPGYATQLAGQVLAARFLALTIGGRLQEAEELALTVHHMAVQHSSHDGLATMSCALGQVSLAQGRPRTALGWLREAAALLRVHDRNGFLPWCLGELAGVASIIGDLDEATAALAEADGRRHPGLALFDVELEIGRAWRVATGGDHQAALGILEDAYRWAMATGQLVFAGLALHAAVRLGSAAEVVERLEALAERVDAREVVIGAAHARASVDRNAEALEDVATAYEGIGALLRAAEAATEAVAVHRAAGRTRAASAAAERARVLAQPCEGACTPGLATADMVEPVSLTKREEEVARLAAQGLASRAIAERLFLSVRTVDNHLHRAYYKLGVSSRRELATVLGVERLSE